MNTIQALQTMKQILNNEITDMEVVKEVFRALSKHMDETEDYISNAHDIIWKDIPEERRNFA